MIRTHARPFYIGTTAERTATTLPADAQGSSWYDTDVSITYTWSGTAWVTIGSGIDVTEVSKLVSPNGTIDPVFSADNSGNVTAVGSLLIPEYLIHVGDADTHWRFQDDRIDLTAGNVLMLSLIETTQDIVQINGGQADTDFEVDWDNGVALFIEGSSGIVNIAQYLARQGDNDTYIRFQDDQIDLHAGGVKFISIYELSQDIVIFNDDGIDIDYAFEASGVPFALLIQGSDGKVGINTAAIPHGGVGAAMLAIDGPHASANGPHIQLTTQSDDYSIAQVLIHSHDNVALSFDAYYDYSSWKSGSPGSNFQIYKQANILRFRYDNGVTAGSTLTWNEGIAMDTAGRVAIGAVPTAVLGMNFQVQGLPYGFASVGSAAGVGSTAVNLLTGLSHGASFLFVARCSNGEIRTGTNVVESGVPFTLFFTSNQFEVRYNSGNVDFRRTSGTLTASIVIFAVAA